MRLVLGSRVMHKWECVGTVKTVSKGSPETMAVYGVHFDSNPPSHRYYCTNHHLRSSIEKGKGR